MEFGEHSTKHPHTKFQTQILMYGKAAALGSLLHTLINRPTVSLVWSYYISSLDDIDLKSEISDKCHKTDQYYL
jgi:hypothetical protein